MAKPHCPPESASDQQTESPTPAIAKDARQARLERQLKANLARRKQAAKARTEPPDSQT